MTPLTAIVAPAATAAGQGLLGGFDVALPPEVRRVAHMRRVTAAHLRYWDLDALVDSATVIVSELVTNAIQHGLGQQPIGLRVTRSAHELRIEVTDGTPQPARVRRANDDDEHGRGLPLVAGLADGWGVSRDGAMTWATFVLPAGRT
ncbi:ATP-binding protein [Streptomyces violens]|uniref:ATP-binding protein n=1 Tax=Streptomyces violens TaxID=66377 RepID=UPI0004BFC9C9|nr:ATP-binding protein [Streptomyces violens]